MSWNVTAEPEEFSEAVDFFRSRFPVTEELSDALGDYAGERAWTIAGVAQLDVVNDVHSSLLKAIASGTPFEQWQKDVEASLTQAWGRKNSHRIETIFRNATSQAYNAGRWRQMHEPSVLALRPFGLFDGVEDSRQSPFCRAWDGTILPLDEFAERGACPQTHHRCRSQIRSIRATEAQRRGITRDPPTIQADKGFGKAPTGNGWQPERAKYHPALFSEFERKSDEIRDGTTRKRVKPSKKTTDGDA